MLWDSWILSIVPWVLIETIDTEKSLFSSGLDRDSIGYCKGPFLGSWELVTMGRVLKLNKPKQDHMGITLCILLESFFIWLALFFGFCRRELGGLVVMRGDLS